MVDGTVVDSDEAADDEPAEAPVSLVLEFGELVDSEAGRVWSVSFFSSGFSEVTEVAGGSLSFLFAEGVKPLPAPPRPIAALPDGLERLDSDGRPRNDAKRELEPAGGCAVLVVVVEKRDTGALAGVLDAADDGPPSADDELNLFDPKPRGLVPPKRPRLAIALAAVVLETDELVVGELSDDLTGSSFFSASGLRLRLWKNLKIKREKNKMRLDLNFFLRGLWYSPSSWWRRTGHRCGSAS